MPKSTLSVILANFNHAQYLPESLGALVSQTRIPDEIIIVDDASTDNSVEVIQSFAAKCPAIKLHRNETNRGPFYSADRAMQLATGDYIYFGAADDRTGSTLMEKSMAMAEQYPHAALTCSEPSTFDGHTGVLSENRNHWSDAPRYFSPDEFADVLAGRFIAGNTGVFKRDLVIRAGGFHPELRWHMDFFLNLVLAFRHGVCYIPESLSHLRVLTESYSARGMRDPGKQIPVIRHLFRLLKSETYRDLLPYLAKSSALKAVGPLIVPAYLSDPEHWDPITQSLLVEPLAEWGVGKAMDYAKKQIDIQNENQWRYVIGVANSYAGAGKRAEACALLRTLAQQYPEPAIIRENLARVESEMQLATAPAKPVQAAPRESVLLGDFPDDIKIGIGKQRSGDYHGAIAVYGDILEKDPENLHALHLMGIIGIQVQDLEIAKELLARAASIDETIPSFYRKLDVEFNRPGLYAETLRCFRSSLGSAGAAGDVSRAA